MKVHAAAQLEGKVGGDGGDLVERMMKRIVAPGANLDNSQTPWSKWPQGIFSGKSLCVACSPKTAWPSVGGPETGELPVASNHQTVRAMRRSCCKNIVGKCMCCACPQKTSRCRRNFSAS